MKNSPEPRTPRDDDELVDNLPHKGTDDVEKTPTDDSGDETQLNEERSTEEGIEDRPRERESDRQDVESP
jgi:hypothetical protein